MTKKKPTVSVVITSFNKADTILRAICSATKQTIRKLEVIVVDDGSTDGSVAVLKNTKLPKSVKVIYSEHNGMMKAFETGFNACTGDYIATLDADDYWGDKDKLIGQLQFLEWEICELICQSPTHVTYDSLLCSNPIVASSIVFRASTFREIIDFNRFVRMGFICQDYPILLEFARRGMIYTTKDESTICQRCSESISNTRKRGKRLRIILGINKIRIYFILKYGCKSSTLFKLGYKFIRDLFCVITKRWSMY